MSVGGDSRFVNGAGGGAFGGGNVYNWSAQNLAGAGRAAGTAADMYANGGISPNASLADTATMDAATSNAATAAGPANIFSGIQGYMNPYTDAVIGRSLADIGRMNEQQLNQVGAQATQAGAFGGSRHGLVEAATNAESQRVAGDLSAQMRNQGWNQAAALSGQDIANQAQNAQFNANAQNAMGQFNAGAQNVANQYNAGAANANNQYNAGAQNARDLAVASDLMNRAGGLNQTSQQLQNLGTTGYNMGQQTAAGQMQAGSLQQQLQQMILNQANQQFQQTANQPQNMLDTMLGALGMSPLNNARTQTQNYTPGLFDYLSLGAGLASSGLQGRWA